MQDPATFQPMKPHFPEQEHLKCPRCDSTNTKFCYYNNYNLSQPRHFCKNCRRYWTKGGALRNIPVGGGSRKNTKRASNPKRPASAATATSNSSSISSISSNSSPVFPKAEETGVFAAGGGGLVPVDQDRRMLDMTGSFSSLLASNGQFGNLLESFNPSDRTIQFGEFAAVAAEHSHSNSSSFENLAMDLQNGGNQDGLLSIQGSDSSCWGGGNSGWPDLAI
ncbi:hypothetical protein Scep_008198 [Stephania cephalantha]|uniref:Dof zinc finger protein n=1 Tax=Stephania cephalantha TaxID=152367 RepID=A0AAP0PQQ7_9MAGN